jgi:dipeptidyl aminopeptidase/acylaminoacyl peptidase
MTYAQDNLVYQKPSDEILSLVDVQLAPNILMNNDKSVMILLYRDAYKSIDELSRKEMRLAGLRIDPATNIGSRTTYFNNMRIKHIGGDDQTDKQISGLPAKTKITGFRWSPDYSKIAFTNTSEKGVELWVVDIASASAKKLTDAVVNANMRDAINWFSNSKSILINLLPADKSMLIDTENTVPSGPTISVSDGKKAQNRTYQDLLKNVNDEKNFEVLATSEVYRVDLEGNKSKFLDAAMYKSISFSPDGNYVLVSKIERPFSYLVPYRRFPSVSTIYDKNGREVIVANKTPLLEDLPKGFMSTQKGKRSWSWRADKAASLIYAVALDGGDPANEVEYRDEVFQWDAPFKDEAKSLVKTKNRYSYISWANDRLAIVHDYWWNTRNTKSYLFDPSGKDSEVKTLIDRNYQDRYSDPGDFVTDKNEFGRNVLVLDNGKAFLLGDGYTKEGQFPFLSAFDLESGETERLYTSAVENQLETLYDFDMKKNQLLLRVESKNDYPNYYFRDLDKKTLSQVTYFENPFRAIQNVEKEVITYKRADGLELSGTLYLPVGYDKSSKEKMPMILWAYPREFKDKNSASQNTQNPNEFTYPYWGSPIYWVNKGYVVLDDAAFPIVGEGDNQPNDSFREQLVANAKAAIDAVDNMGYIDRERVAVGGHSYGAFMVANLLSHSDLFAAGIARSGAYNRTLTPFGFQSEERSYWEAPEVYYTMSPFMHADKMKTPLLLIHGEADNNSGTYPLQSERYFNALKGLGATARLVMLPKESHGYRAKESILHLLWEQDEWLDKYVKNKDKLEQED